LRTGPPAGKLRHACFLDRIAVTDTTRARVYAPATVGNVLCGFDVFGLALERPGDVVEARRCSEPGVAIAAIHGDGGRLPTDPDQNVAGVAARAVIEAAGLQGVGVELEVWKGLPLSGGMGGSAASSVAAVVATNTLLDAGLSKEVQLLCTLEGEHRATGASHPDNSAPSLHGGIVMVRPEQPGVAIPLPVPVGLAVALVHPPLELGTGAMRRALPEQVPLDRAVTQWANCAALVVGLYEEDWELLGRALVDEIAAPHRNKHVPGFDEVRSAALEAGAVGAGLSGSGPSMFALCRNITEAAAAADAMTLAFTDVGLAGADRFVSLVGSGARVVEDVP
jgi:homoserine kinase